MTIKKILETYNLTQKALADRFGIPKRSIENWAEGKRNPPEYLTKLLIECLDHDRAASVDSCHAIQKEVIDMNYCKKFLSCPKVVGNPYQWQNPCPCKDYEPSQHDKGCSNDTTSTTDADDS